MLAFIVAPIAGKLTVRVQSRFMMGLGLFLVALGCELMSHVHASSTWVVLLPGFLVCGVGIGITNPVLASASVSVVPPERSGMSTGAASTFRQIGIATGIAGLGAIFVHQIKSTSIAALHSTPAGQAVLAHGGSRLGAALSTGGVRQVAASIPSESGRNALLTAYQTAFTTTFDHLMGIAAAIAFVGAVGSLILVRQKDFVPSHGPAGSSGGPASGASDSEWGPTTATPATPATTATPAAHSG